MRLCSFAYPSWVVPASLAPDEKRPRLLAGPRQGHFRKYARVEKSSPARIPNSGRWNWFRWFPYGDGGEEGEALRLSWLSCRAMLFSSSVARISVNRSITAVSALI